MSMHKILMRHILVLLAVLFIAAMPPASVAQRQTEFSRENALDVLRTLCVTIGPRPMGSPAEHRALSFAVEKFRQYGCDTAYLMTMDHSTRSNTNSGIAIGIKRGATGRIICLGGHIDSAGPEIPGADDDGSGAATVIELARVLSRRSNQSTIVFCCFGGEEQGLEGSKYFVDHFPQLDSIAMMVQVDMANGLGVIDLDPDTYHASAPKWLVRAAVEEFYNLGYERLRYPTHFAAINYSAKESSGSDHEPFLRKGIPAIDFSTDVNKPIHTPQDNWANFDPGGLQRSGDVALKLVERFDGGVPAGKPERYWLYLFRQTPIFLPIWGLWLLYAASFGVAIAALILIYHRRPARLTPVSATFSPEGDVVPPPSPLPRIRKSGLKLFLFTLIAVSFGWFSPDLIGLIKGLRHPWFIDLRLYYLYAGIAVLLALWLIAVLSRRLRITKDPFPLYRNALIVLLLYFGALTMINIKLGLYPAAGMLLLGVAMFSREGLLKYLLLLAAPMLTLRLVFSEWDGLTFRSIAMGLPVDRPGLSALFNAGFILMFSLTILPYVFGAAAIIRDTSEFETVTTGFRSKGWLMISGGIFVILTVLLIARPSYDRFWSKDVHINQKYDLNTKSFTNTIQSSEYLSHLEMRHDAVDTMINGRSAILTVAPRSSYDTTWFGVSRHETRTTSGDTTFVDLELTLTSAFRPYTIQLTYQAGKGEPAKFQSPWLSRSREAGGTEMRWYSFPDTHIVVPVRFAVVGGDSVKETISAVFDTLAYPMSLEGELTYVIPRTEYTAERVYRK